MAIRRRIASRWGRGGRAGDEEGLPSNSQGGPFRPFGFQGKAKAIIRRSARWLAIYAALIYRGAWRSGSHDTETHVVRGLAASVLLGEVALAQRSAENPEVRELWAFSIVANAPESRLNLIPS
jgi:hypothetical protein